jgi:hypothetical protein
MPEQPPCLEGLSSPIAIQSLEESIVHGVIYKLGKLRKQKARPKPGF